MNTKDLKNQLRRKYKNFLNRMAAINAPIEKKITFESFSGRQYSDNPRFISEKMHELFPDYQLVWVLDDPGKRSEVYLPDYIKVVRTDSPECRKERATSFAFIKNEPIKEDQFKRKGQVFIQTWHGDRGIKKILFDSLAAKGVSPKGYGYADHKLTDLFVVGSDYAEKRIKTAFRYQGEVIKSGCPRNDCLISPKDTQEIRNRIGIPADKKVLLFAPTLQKNHEVVRASVDIAETLEHLKKRDERDWICLVRAHPKSVGIEMTSGGDVIDVSKYPDMADLLLIADCLITDYSSSAGDFILTKKPLILAQFDQEQYMKEEREFHVDINQVGFLIARSQQELNNYVDTLSDEDFADRAQKIIEYFGTCETGHAAEDVCRLIDSRYREMYGIK